ncbi:MAG: hypothetical protein QNJ60_05650 [Xenococcaceae cyanobacterium MO_188.B19]|nr:hypothetical protein [Xenococcaceae cyanobacterium MO_188.B19]
MSLLTVQQVLARIYTDSKLRDDFLTNPDVVGISLGLNCQEIAQLSKLSRQQVNLFASSLKRKRLGEIHKLLPLTHKLLGKKFDSLFSKYSETYLPTGSKKHLLDAVAFSNFLQEYLTIDDPHPTWLLDILRYEKVRLQMFREKRLFICDRFDYNLESLINNLDFNSQPVLRFKPNIGIWFRLTSNSNWRSLFLPIPQFSYILNLPKLNKANNSEIY